MAELDCTRSVAASSVTTGDRDRDGGGDRGREVERVRAGGRGRERSPTLLP